MRRDIASPPHHMENCWRAVIIEDVQTNGSSMTDHPIGDAAMNSKERVVAAINHQLSDRVPLDGYFRQDVWAMLEDHFETKDAQEIMDELGLDIRYSMLEPSASFVERAIPSPRRFHGTR